MVWVGFAAAIAVALGAFLLALMSGRRPGGRGFQVLVLGVIFLAAIASAVSTAVMHNRESSMQLEFEREMRASVEATLSAVTGGDSFCTINLLKPISEVTHLVVSNRGESPLYDVSARIVDLQKSDEVLDGSGTFTFDDLNQFQTILDLGNIPPEQVVAITERWPIGAGDRKEYNVFFTARNGSWFERIRMVKVDGEWKVAIRVYRGVGDAGGLLYEKIDKGYPLKEEP